MWFPGNSDGRFYEALRISPNAPQETENVLARVQPQIWKSRAGKSTNFGLQPVLDINVSHGLWDSRLKPSHVLYNCGVLLDSNFGLNARGRPSATALVCLLYNIYETSSLRFIQQWRFLYVLVGWLNKWIYGCLKSYISIRSLNVVPTDTIMKGFDNIRRPMDTETWIVDASSTSFYPPERPQIHIHLRRGIAQTRQKRVWWLLGYCLNSPVTSISYSLSWDSLFWLSNVRVQRLIGRWNSATPPTTIYELFQKPLNLKK